jgi:iron(III) transport system substrate-binding protein
MEMSPGTAAKGAKTRMFDSRTPKRIAGAILAAGLLAGATNAAQAEGEVNIYSYRQEVLIRPLLDRFEEDTGITVNVVFVDQGMIERMKAEGENTPADVVLTVDVARLMRIKREGLLQPIQSETLNDVIPAQYRDPEGEWYGLTVRARTIVYNPERVDAGELSTYRALADEKWRDRICIRSSTHVYNQSLVASFIAHWGAEATEEWAEQFVQNLARRPRGGDRDQIRAVAAGECDLAIINTYYFAGMASSSDEDDREVANQVRLFWPNQDGYGVHVNISGAGVTRYAPNRENAIRLLEFLVSEEAQEIYAHQVNEYPVREGVEPSEAVRAWGPFKADDMSLATIADHVPEAVRIADRAGWR